MISLLFSLAFLIPSTATAGLSLSFAHIFKGGAVLQRGENVSIWGSSGSKKDTSVILYVDGVESALTHVDAFGNWSAKLPRYQAAFDRTLSVDDGTGNISIIVSFGDVILCSGQSNMQMPVGPTSTGFFADNGTAESAASGRFKGKIWLMSPQSHAHWPDQFGWNSPSNTTLPTFSAVCWYTGKSLSEFHKGNIAIGLVEAAVGGSPIEYWIPKDIITTCETDIPPCDTQLADSVFFEKFIQPIQPYTFGTVIWDQAERDVKCNHTDKYACMERELVANWRKGFKSYFSFIVVQMPGYFDPVESISEVFEMRLAQEAGLHGVGKSSIVATYDLSCPLCRKGSVHNMDKTDIGIRIAIQQRHLRGVDLIFEGPRVQSISVLTPNWISKTNGNYIVTVTFSGGTEPFFLRGTRNCTTCCKAMGDFDASVDGITWVNGTAPKLIGSTAIHFNVILPASPKIVRYTAAGHFPQCAIYNQEALPALPFQMSVTPALPFQMSVTL